MNRLEEYGYASLYKALKHKYKYALSTNLPRVSRRSQFLALLCIFPELISLQESSCRTGADLGFFTHQSNAEGVSHGRGGPGACSSAKILKSRLSEMQFPAFPKQHFKDC